MLHKKRKPSTFTSSSGVDCKYDTARKDMLHSKSTYFYGWNSLVPSVCGLALLFGLGIILNPAINSTEEVYAETIMANPTDYSSISLTISNNGTELNTGDTVSANVEPGLISYFSNNLKIDTKKINRFYVSVQAAEDGSSELTGTNNHATIAPVGSNKIPTATDENGFGDNTWGFALGETSADNSSMSYNSLPAYGASTTPQYSSASNLADGTYNLKLTFAAKINADKPSDHYTTKAMVSVAADAKYISGFINLDTDQPITTMQEMTSDICKYAPDGHSTQLKDSRDGKFYWVSKVNNQCIMTQNLDYDLNAAVPLTPDDSDVRSNWTPTASTLTGTSWSWENTDNSISQSYDPGLFYLNDATSSWTQCKATKDPKTCSRYTHILDPNAVDENLHYAVGNYYSYSAATAESSTSLSAGEPAANSICPKGWKLFDNSGAKSFKTVFTGATSDTIRKSPYYIPPTGCVTTVGISVVGSDGNYWSSTTKTPDTDNTAYYLHFKADNIYPTNSYYRFAGNPIRCIAK